MRQPDGAVYSKCGWTIVFLYSCRAAHIALCECVNIFGATLSEFHIDHDNRPRARNNCGYVCTCMYICIIDQRLAHPGSWDPCTPWDALCIDVLMCVIYNCRTEHVVCREDYRRRQVCECADTSSCINGFKLLIREWSCFCLTTCQCTCVNQKPRGVGICFWLGGLK